MATPAMTAIAISGPSVARRSIGPSSTTGHSCKNRAQPDVEEKLAVRRGRLQKLRNDLGGRFVVLAIPGRFLGGPYYGT